RRSLSRSAWPVLRDVRVPLSRHGCGEKDVPKTPPGQSAMKHALLLLLLAIGFRDQPVAHQAPAQQTRPGCNHAYWSYYPAYTHQQHGTYGYAAHYPSVLPYPYPLPLPPPPPLPPHSPGPWIPGPSHPPVPPPPPAPKNLDPFPGKFLGMGSVRYVNGARDVELICNLQGDKIVSVSGVMSRDRWEQIKSSLHFNDNSLCPSEDKLFKNVVWVKATNTPRQPPASWQPPYHHPHQQQPGSGQYQPGYIPNQVPGGPSHGHSHACGPCFCPVPTCTYQPIDYSSRRLFADAHGPQAVLHVYGVEPGDYGVYRCSATSLRSGSAMGDTETVYQIVEFTG
ncbi:hypothetical protein HPB47_007253, partial [Ixodes persulcatus]